MPASKLARPRAAKPKPIEGFDENAAALPLDQITEALFAFFMSRREASRPSLDSEVLLDFGRPGLGAGDARRYLPNLIDLAQETPQLIENKRSHKRAMILSPELLTELLGRLRNPVGALLDQFEAEDVEDYDVRIVKWDEPVAELLIADSD